MLVYSDKEAKAAVMRAITASPSPLIDTADHRAQLALIALHNAAGESGVVASQGQCILMNAWGHIANRDVKGLRSKRYIVP